MNLSRARESRAMTLGKGRWSPTNEGGSLKVSLPGAVIQAAGAHDLVSARTKRGR